VELGKGLGARLIVYQPRTSPAQNNTTYIAAGIGAGVGLCALAALVILLVARRRKSGTDAAGKRETIAFENPTVSWQ
jgi:hypothetical protein